jgi:muconolactone D-isomerase
MMEFLVRIEVRDRDLPIEGRQQLLEKELQRAQELMAAGTLRRIWRLPGKRANLSLYSVASANELHDALTSLPLWNWMELSVEALATHPVEEA